MLELDSGDLRNYYLKQNLPTDKLCFYIFVLVLALMLMLALSGLQHVCYACVVGVNHPIW